MSIVVELGECLEFELANGRRKRVKLIGGNPPVWQDLENRTTPPAELNALLGFPWVEIRRIPRSKEQQHG